VLYNHLFLKNVSSFIAYNVYRFIQSSDVESLRQKMRDMKDKDFSITDEKLNSYQRRTGK
jgi:hypothetical protein